MPISGRRMAVGPFSTVPVRRRAAYRGTFLHAELEYWNCGLGVPGLSGPAVEAAGRCAGEPVDCLGRVSFSPPGQFVTRPQGNDRRYAVREFWRYFDATRYHTEKRGAAQKLPTSTRGPLANRARFLAQNQGFCQRQESTTDRLPTRTISRVFNRASRVLPINPADTMAAEAIAVVGSVSFLPVGPTVARSACRVCGSSEGANCIYFPPGRSCPTDSPC